ncbi:MAG: hypothetical protein SGJ24_08490 [Chloroflexota bacterium]|nr:hypothetical protein [Chloroflexota bacterium]
MATKNEIPDLLRRGIDLAREGKKADARVLFEQVTELDENNEKGWFWLASVVDTDEERRICFSNVLHINPNNEKAQRAMASLEERLKGKKKQQQDAEVVAGIPRSQFNLILGAGIAIVAVILLVGLVVIIGNNNRIASENATATTIAVVATDARIVEETAQAVGTANAIALAATQTALVPTPVPITPTSNIPTLPPEWTATPSQTPMVTSTSMPAPLGLAGRLVVWGGRDELNTGYLPVGYYNLDFGNQYTRIGNELGAHVSIAANGQRVTYERYDELLFSSVIEAINLNGTEILNLAEVYNESGLTVVGPRQPNFDAAGQRVTFAARTSNRNTYQVFLVDVGATDPAQRIRQLTDDESDYSYPAFSPDGSRIAAVRADLNSAAPGVDLVNIDASNGGKFLITNDLQTFSETMPRWSSDGVQVIYAAASANAPENNDIFTRRADGSGSSLPLYRHPSNDIYPIFSRDARYMAVASNRTGNYDIFIYDTVNQTTAQLTNAPGDEFPGGWWQP